MAENNRNNILNDDDRLYLEMIQNNINRMASNSSNTKNWMITIVSAIMALQCSTDLFNGWIFIEILPIFLFWYLDVYYLHLERGMRNRETQFINILKSENTEKYKSALFNFKPFMIKKNELTQEKKQNGFVATNDRWFTKSIFPFYGMTCIAVAILSQYI